MKRLDTLRQDCHFTGDIAADARHFLEQHGFPKTAAHVEDVAEEAGRLAALFGADVQSAQVAGWLHDISVVIPNSERISAAEEWGVEVLPEEAIFPMIIHQKLSVVIAQALFGIQDADILSAIGCHTTLKAGASRLDKIVFVADKIAWDQPGKPPYYDAIVAALDISIDQAAFVYADYLWQIRDQLKVLHPWAREAYWELSQFLEQ
ncbi:MAG: bis(5'-nucleosyl)-tetraphosphatase (symmetrical) YqeK [Anaerolineae bacterium]|nr:bis(5'-nucleosyl)-tetraphosphatase (symmetrical) YqeK [Anaerolineae bacterium]